MLTGDKEPEESEAETLEGQSGAEVKTEEAAETEHEAAERTHKTTGSVTQQTKEPEKTEIQPETEKKVPEKRDKSGSKEHETLKTVNMKKQETEKVESVEEQETVKEEKSPETEPEKVETEKLEEEAESKPDKPETERSGNMTLLEGREKDTITREDVDENFKEEIMATGVESLALCFQCGTCSGACPSGRRTPYKVRQLVRRAVMGLKEDVISDDTIWMCTTCYECQERCPRTVKIVDVVKAVRNEAAKAGYMAPAHKATGSFVIKTGHGVPINPATRELRKKIGLSELPPTTHEFPEALEEVQKITKITAFDKLVGYNWETGELE